MPGQPLATRAPARLALREGQHQAAAELILGIDVDPSRSTLRERVETAVLTAKARASIDPAAAERVLRQSLSEPAALQLRRLLADEGPELADLLQQFRHPAAAAVAADVHSGGASSYERLSERERVVLEYLPTRMSNQDIAAELYVSLNTVKTHLKSVYRKLGATTRNEAVSHAIASGLLRPDQGTTFTPFG